MLKGTLTATGTGNLAFAWSQTASSTTATNVGPGSYLKVTRIA